MKQNYNFKKIIKKIKKELSEKIKKFRIFFS